MKRRTAMKIIQALREWVCPPIDWDLAVVLSRHPADHERLILHAVWGSLKLNFGASTSWDPTTVKLRYPTPSGPIGVDLVLVESDQIRTPAKVVVTLGQNETGQFPISAQWRRLPDLTKVITDQFSRKRSRDLHFAVY
jgi:hypothetical protein